ncbi:MAG TPA: O-antigen ligase family protein [Verrucomicrobiae bacterium]|jgi:O-antigen ligase|nr:O-antigen ligase family protein [Verrucomicrobiae bacterium]
MPPFLALLLTFALIIYLFRRDAEENANVTSALWVPLIWLMIVGSRAVSQWLWACGIHGFGAVTVEEGSPIDALVVFILIVLGVRILVRRNISFWEFARRNKWIVLYLAYCFISIAWSELPFVALKRWIKILGHPIMVLVVLTEPDPKAAVIRLMQRCAYVIVPLSITLIKYFPNVGREYDPFTGAAMNSGVTIHKNLLGCDSMILECFFFWRWLSVRQMEKTPERRRELILIAAFGCMIGWLFNRTHSSTSLGAFAVGILVMLALGLPNLNREKVGVYALVFLVVAGLSEWMFGISSMVIQLLGRDPTLTGRVFIWQETLALQPNALLGAGFESFWLGDRLAKMWELHWWHPNEAHNGYLETYLSLGAIGLALLLGAIVVAFRHAKDWLVNDFEQGRFRLGFLAAIVVYNWTEAAFKGLSFIFFMFYVVAISYRSPAIQSVGEASELEAADDDDLVDEHNPAIRVRPI